MSGAYNWAEVGNPTGEPAAAEVSLYDRSNAILWSTVVTLAPHAQAHFDLYRVLGPENIGVLWVRCAPEGGATRLIAENMFYGQPATTGGPVREAYATQAGPGTRTARTGLAT